MATVTRVIIEFDREIGDNVIDFLRNMVAVFAQGLDALSLTTSEVVENEIPREMQNADENKG